MTQGGREHVVEMMGKKTKRGHGSRAMKKQMVKNQPPRSVSGVRNSHMHVFLVDPWGGKRGLDTRGEKKNGKSRKLV